MREDRQAYDFYNDPANQVPAGPGQRRHGRRLSETVPVRFPLEVIEAVRRLALQDGVTVSTWIRNLVGKEIQRRRPSATSASAADLSVELDYSEGLRAPSETTSDPGLIDFATC